MRPILFILLLVVLGISAIVAGVGLLAGAGFALIVFGLFSLAAAAVVLRGIPAPQADDRDSQA